MATIEQAIGLAARVHAGQKDKAGQPYILHPLRVMLGVKSETGRIAAVLHDVVEDSATTLDDLRHEGFPEDVVRAVDALSKREGEAWEEYLQRVKVDPLAIEVKLSDLRDNMDRKRFAQVTDKDERHFEKYRAAWEFLTGEPCRDGVNGEP